MKKKEASASCSALIRRRGQRVRAKRGPMINSAASRRMAACTFVAILRDAREERAPQDEDKSDLHVQPLGRIARREYQAVVVHTPSFRDAPSWRRPGIHSLQGLSI